MPTPTKGKRLGGSPAHQRLMLANLATQLFEHKRITTTVTKAKRLRPYAERLITFAKRGDLAARRRVLTMVTDKGIVHELFTEIAPAVANREGGYTRITKIGNRQGDNAPMAVIELVMEPVSAKQAVVAEASAAAAAAAPAAASADSADSPESADSADSPESADSADSAESADETPEAAQADVEGAQAAQESAAAAATEAAVNNAPNAQPDPRQS